MTFPVVVHKILCSRNMTNWDNVFLRKREYKGKHITARAYARGLLSKKLKLEDDVVSVDLKMPPKEVVNIIIKDIKSKKDPRFAEELLSLYEKNGSTMMMNAEIARVWKIVYSPLADAKQAEEVDSMIDVLSQARDTNKQVVTTLLPQIMETSPILERDVKHVANAIVLPDPKLQQIMATTAQSIVEAKISGESQPSSIVFNDSQMKLHVLGVAGVDVRGDASVALVNKSFYTLWIVIALTIAFVIYLLVMFHPTFVEFTKGLEDLTSAGASIPANLKEVAETKSLGIRTLTQIINGWLQDIGRNQYKKRSDRLSVRPAQGPDDIFQGQGLFFGMA